MPANYDFNPSRISRALNHTTVRLTWDQSDPKRLQRLQQNYKAVLGEKKGKKKKQYDSEEEMEAYKDLIAGSSDNDYDDENDEQNEKKDKQAHIEEMRKKLLSGLDNIETGYRKNKDLQGSDNSDDSDVKEMKI